MAEFNLSPNLIFTDQIQIKKINHEKAMELIKKLDLPEEDIKFNGNIGSIFMRLEEMERRYDMLKREKNQYELKLLWILKKMYICGLYDGFQQFPLKWVKKYCSHQDDYDLHGLEWPVVLKRLMEEEFIHYSKKRIKIDEIYLEIVVMCLITESLYELIENMTSIFFDDPNALYKLGMRAFYYGSVENGSNINLDIEISTPLFGFLDLSKKCFDEIIESDPKNTIAWETKLNVLYELGNKEEASECYDKIIELHPEYKRFSLGAIKHNFKFAVNYIRRKTNLENEEIEKEGQGIEISN